MKCWFCLFLVIFCGVVFGEEKKDLDEVLKKPWDRVMVGGVYIPSDYGPFEYLRCEIVRDDKVFSIALNSEHRLVNSEVELKFNPISGECVSKALVAIKKTLGVTKKEVGPRQLQQIELKKFEKIPVKLRNPEALQRALFESDNSVYFVTMVSVKVGEKNYSFRGECFDKNHNDKLAKELGKIVAEENASNRK